MNAQQILDALLNSGKELAEKGKTLAEAKLNVPDDPEKREAMLTGAGKGALAAGALAVLLGTGTGRKLTGATLKLGSLAAIGGVAYKAFENWKSQQSDSQIVSVEKTADQLTGEASENRSRAIIRAMIASAKADGHIDTEERKIISQHAEKLGLESSVATFIKDELTTPLNVKEVAAGADSPEAAAEIYLVSMMTLNLDNDKEREYLAQLAQALELAPDLIAELEQQATA
ncbi:MAG: tellurite resistance TerB family protein [Methylococcaceae bacterium]|nr:tellurite resistance TerB family protein [Methylococcaceae bacterium]